jgi:hypothetical protein
VAGRQGDCYILRFWRFLVGVARDCKRDIYSRFLHTLPSLLIITSLIHVILHHLIIVYLLLVCILHLLYNYTWFSHALILLLLLYIYIYVYL